MERFVQDLRFAFAPSRAAPASPQSPWTGWWPRCSSACGRRIQRRWPLAAGMAGLAARSQCRAEGGL